ncbi:hypothetical protein Tco_0511358 [Tanacetum coccineum]
MKGSREKHGAALAVKLTMKWAPYVYDPIPTSVSHVDINNSTGYMFPEHEKEMVDFRGHEPKPGGIDLHVGNPGRFCRSSFLKRYGTSLHLSSVTDATYASSVGSLKLLYCLCVTT